MEYLVLVENVNGSTYTHLFYDEKAAQKFKAHVLTSRLVKAAFLYKNAE